MYQQIEKTVQCPYCWEYIAVLLDASVPEQEYIEDCQVCCHPITFQVTANESGEIGLQVFHEDA